MKQRRSLVLISMILCMSMVCSQLSIVKAEEEIECNHVHNEECGLEDNEGNYQECSHVHDIDCAKESDFEEESMNDEEITKSIQSLESVTASVVQKELVIDFTDSMETDIKTAESTIQDKSKITTIKVKGNAESITGINDWLALIRLFDTDSGYSNGLTLDLSEMSNLQTIGNSGDSGSNIVDPRKLKEVKLPNSLKTIGNNAFDGCTNLTTINLPDGLEKINDDAFFNCSSLALDKLLDSIKEIGNRAFSGCANISLTKLPNSLTALGYSAFNGCTKLAITELPKGITVINWQTFIKTGIKEIVIHEGITDIESSAFKSCLSLSKITFMGDIPEIGDFAFDNITNKVEIIYPVNAKNKENLDGQFASSMEKKMVVINYTGKSMDDSITKAFEEVVDTPFDIIKVTGDATGIKGTDWLALIRLFNSKEENKNPANLTLDLSELSKLQTIGDYEGTLGSGINPIKLKEVKLPNSLKTIGRKAFDGCTNLTTINLPDGLDKIDTDAFNNCSSLALDKLPDSIKEIGNQAFVDCVNLSLTKLPNSLTTLEQSAFIGCTKLAITKLPKDITIIYSQTFSGTGIKELVIHEGITDIEASAFKSCSSLSKITFKGNSPLVKPTAFKNIASSGEIYYPEGASDYEWIATMLPTWKVNPKEIVPSGISSSHSHYYGKQWKTDEENHWYECSCGKQKDLEAHEFSEWVEIDEEHRERECNICGFIQKETFIHRQLTDALTGVQLSGIMSERAELVVSESPTHAAGLCSACDEIRSLMSEGKLIKAYEISLVGDYKGELTLSFPMDPKYNGESFMLYHYAEDGRVYQLISVSNGKAEGKVHTLSPFAIVRSNEIITQQVSLTQGEHITIYPASMDGVWAYDDEMIQLTQNGDSYTLTAIKEGSTSAVYTTKTTQTIVEVNVQTSHVPNTNDAMNHYILISILSLCAIMIIRLTKETTSA